MHDVQSAYGTHTASCFLTDQPIPIPLIVIPQVLRTQSGESKIILWSITNWKHVVDFTMYTIRLNSTIADKSSFYVLTKLDFFVHMHSIFFQKRPDKPLYSIISF